MMYIAQFVQILVQVLTIAIFLRAIISWFQLAPDNPIVVILTQITDPILTPLRRIVPSFGMFDLTPVIAMVLLQFVGGLIVSNLY